jgi:hypothetical protein
VFLGPIGDVTPPATTSTLFKTPAGIAMGASPGPGSVTIYVADPLNNQLVVFLPGSPSPTLVTSLTCPSTVSGCFVNPWPLSRPTFVAAAPNGNIWISDTANDVVIEADPSFTVVAFAGQGPSNVVNGCGLFGCPSHPNSGQGNGQFFGPGPLAVDSSGNVYVADAAGAIMLSEQLPSAANIRVQKFAGNGSFLTTWGSWCTLNSSGTQFAGNCNTSAPGAVALGDGQFSLVTGIAVDASNGVYVAEDGGNNRIQKFSANGTFLLKWGGLPTGSGAGQFNSPAGIAVDFDQSIYVVDELNDRIQVFDASGGFISTGGSRGIAEAEFNHPFAIATVPPAVALLCVFAGDPDCVHGLAVSEFGSHTATSGNTRVQFLAERPDTDNDGITDEVDTEPNTFSNDFSNAPLGFTTTGSITSRGNQTFSIYNTLTPNVIDEIRVRTESFGGPAPLTLTLCGALSLSLPAASGVNLHCSTPTVATEFGPVGFRFVGSDGTVATATLKTGDSLSVNATASQITDNAGTVAVSIGGKVVSLSPGQTATVLTPDFSISATPRARTLSRGDRAKYSITVTPESGFNGRIALHCTGGPPESDCDIRPNRLEINGVGSVSATAVVHVAREKSSVGTYSITFTGISESSGTTSGGLKHSTSVSLDIKRGDNEHDNEHERGDNEHE